MLSVSRCMDLNFGMTRTMRIVMETSSTPTAMPVASVHSRPSPAILQTAQTAIIGDLTIIINPMVMNI